MNNILEWTTLSMLGLLSTATDRQEWRNMTAAASLIARYDQVAQRSK